MLPAAAGALVLVKRETFNQIGGFKHIKSALIDDCALARAVKNKWRTDRTHNVGKKLSLRAYPAIKDIWLMITRTAFAQLRYSIVRLALTIAGMALLFLVPIIETVFGNSFEVKISLFTWCVMALIYLPTIRFYKIPFVWAAMLPAAAIIYVAATINSHALLAGQRWKLERQITGLDVFGRIRFFLMLSTRHLSHTAKP